MNPPVPGGIDLHLHTTASDGRCSPRELVERAAQAGLSVIAVTDHDTTAALAEADREARRYGIQTVPGIEITAIEAGRDLHVLGYLFDPGHDGLAAMLTHQRAIRIARIEKIGGEPLPAGKPEEVDAMLARELDRWTKLVQATGMKIE